MFTKFRLIVIFLFSLGFNQLEAQKIADPIVEGYIINLKKDTIKGYITLVNKIQREHGIIFYTKNDVKTKQVFDATKIKAFFMEGKLYEPINYTDTYHKNEKNFAEVVIIGKLSLYYWYGISPFTKGKKEYKPMEIIADEDLQKEPLLKKGSYEVKNLYSMEFNNFKKNFAEYIKENKALAKKIEDKVLTKEQIVDIVEEYNATIKKR